MSEWNTIYSNTKEIIGIFRHGVAWKKETSERLGEYDETGIYDNNRSQIAKIEGDTVSSMDGKELGKIKEKEIKITPELTGTRKVMLVNGSEVGECIGLKEAAAAAIVFFWSDTNANYS